ncbi:MAG: hypothetical protein WBG86_08955 [Polyangiales bacterium]
MRIPAFTRLAWAFLVVVGCQAGPSRFDCGARHVEPDRSAETIEVEGGLTGELDSMPVHEIATADGQVRLRAEAPERPVVRNKDHGEGDREVVIALPGDAEIYCIVYALRNDAASGLLGALRGFDSEKARANELTVEETGAAEVDGRPFLWARAFPETKRDRRGIVHAAVGVTQFETFACRSQRLGGLQTFLRIYRGMLQSLSTPDTEKPADVTYESTRTLRSPDGGIVGFVDDHVQDRPEGTTWRERYASHVTLSSDSHLKASDQRYVETATEDNVIQGFYVRRNDGVDAYTLRMQITGTSPRKYTVTGEVDGEPFEVEFRRPEGLPDVHVQAGELRRLVREAPRKPVPFVQYDPSTSQSEPTTMLVRFDDEEGDAGNATLIVGDKELQATIRESGQIVAGQTLLDGAVVDMKLEWHAGSPLLRVPPTPKDSPEGPPSPGPSEGPPAE